MQGRGPTTGGRSPEELETLLEDAFVIRDRDALAELFEDDAVMDAGPGEARGGDEIGRLVTAMWEDGYRYLADPRRVVQARNTALVVAGQGISVARRRRGGGWRYAISLLDIDATRGGTA